MSRVGNRIISLPEGVEVSVNATNMVTVKGPKGELSKQMHPNIKIEVDSSAKEVTTKRPNDRKQNKQLHGTMNSLIQGMVQGVVEGYKVELEINGVGYRASLAGNKLTLLVGFSHPVEIEQPEGIKFEVPSQTEIIVTGLDKQWTHEIAARIFSVKKPEPYGGKGINYKGRHIRRKAGKSAAK